MCWRPLPRVHQPQSKSGNASKQTFVPTTTRQLLGTVCVTAREIFGSRGGHRLEGRRVGIQGVRASGRSGISGFCPRSLCGWEWSGSNDHRSRYHEYIPCTTLLTRSMFRRAFPQFGARCDAFRKLVFCARGTLRYHMACTYGDRDAWVCRMLSA